MIILYSGSSDPYSQRCRNVVHEKEMDCRIVSVGHSDDPDMPAGITGCRRIPMLVERDLVLCESNIINEFLDERYLGPTLMPADPGLRATARLLLFRMEEALFANIEAIENGSPTQADKGRSRVRIGLAQIAPVFGRQKYLLGATFSLLDIAIAPLLWRLEHYAVQMPRHCAPLMKYAQRLFARSAFIASLTPPEREMRR